MEKIIRENTFEHKKKKPGLSAHRPSKNRARVAEAEQEVIITNIVIRGDWLWKAANINDKNNSATVYVQSTVKVHNPLFSVGKLLRNKLMQRFYWSIQSKW